MKKVLSFVAVAAMVAMTACGGGETKDNSDSLKKDSLRKDSIAKAQADSIKKAHDADSIAKADAAKKLADSLKQDSIDKANKKGGKPKTEIQKIKEEGKKATSGRG